MQRAEWQQLADLRLQDAEVLLAAQRWEASYYLLGYCIECALKACIAKQFRLHDVPDRKLVADFYTHDLEQLVRISGIRLQMEGQFQADSSFSRNWSTVKDWKEDTRYRMV